MQKTKVAYYNEIDPFAANWLRELIKARAIAPGDVDERSVEDVLPADLAPYIQHHFFAGIGGWSYALRLAGWPDDRPVWTGSCPCQPFSEAGKGTGVADERHLWPSWFWLIGQCRPGTIFGEQVSSGGGLEWWDIVATDLENVQYACAAFDLPAASVGAFHRRQRLYWVAHTTSGGRNGHGQGGKAQEGSQPRPKQARELPAGLERRRIADSLGYSGSEGLPGREGEPGNDGAQQPPLERAGSFWADAEWLDCRDGKVRPTQPGVHPLADGVSRRVGKLRGYGNAIVPQLAAEFIKAYMEERQ